MRRTTITVLIFMFAVAAARTPASADGFVPDVPEACQERLVVPSGIDAGTHSGSVDCARFWGLDIFPDVGWDPGRAATRAELAAILARLVDVTVEADAGSTAVPFADAAGHAYADEIGRLSDLGVIGGFTDGTFGPDLAVRRDQMASMMMRLMVDLYDTDLPPANTLPFVDVTDTSVHRESISRILAAGITTGVTSTTFEPGGQVTRAQTITFAVRLLQRLLEDGNVNFDVVDLPLPELDPALIPSTVEEQGIEVGTDLATDEDPGGNEGVDDPDRLERVYGRTWDYTRHRLCTDDLRYELVVFSWLTPPGSLLSFDDEYESRTGLASCIWTSPDADDDMEVRVYQRPRSE